VQIIGANQTILSIEMYCADSYADRDAAFITQLAVVQTQNMARTFKVGSIGEN
jgi:hypothetical protein